MVAHRAAGRRRLRPRLTGVARQRPKTVLGALAGLGLCVLAGCTSTGASVGTVQPPDQGWVATRAVESHPGNTVTLVDLGTHRRAGVVVTGSEPAAMAATPGGGRLVVANRGSDTVSVLDTGSAEVVATIAVGLEPDAVAVAPGGAGVAWVANFGDGTVTPVDLGTLRAGPPVPVGAEPDALAVAGTGSGALLLAANFGDDTLTPVRLGSRQALPPIRVGSEPVSIGVLGAGTPAPTALVGNFGDDTLTPVSVASLQAGAPVPLPVGPTSVAVPRGGTSAWVTGGASLFSVPLATLRPTSVAGLPDVAEAVAPGPDGSAWVALADGVLQQVMPASGSLGARVSVGGRPSAVAVPGT